MSEKPSEHIRQFRNDWVLELHICRPEQKNALSLDMYEALYQGLVAAEDDTTIRAIIITGSEGQFTSGNDLGDFAKAGDSLQREDSPLIRFMYTLNRLTKPVIVAIEGVAVGIGTTMLLHCDVVYAGHGAQFKLPFVQLGLCPEYASSYLLPLRVGTAKANEWLMLGEFFSSREAHEAGLINAVVSDPLAAAREKATQFIDLPPAAVRTTKALLRQPHAEQVEKILKVEFDAFESALKGPEFAEAVSAFFEKRPPNFSQFE